MPPRGRVKKGYYPDVSTRVNIHAALNRSYPWLWRKRAILRRVRLGCFGGGVWAVERPGAVLAPHGPGGFQVAWPEFAGEGLQHVGQGDQAVDLAVFVDDQHELAVGRAELLQQVQTAESLRHAHGRLPRFC